MKKLKLVVPTYNEHYFREAVIRGEKEDYGDPHLPVLIRENAGVRVVLGSHDYDDCSKPDILIERQPNGWVIFLHPEGGNDPCGYVYFLDDGRNFFVKEWGPKIEFLGLWNEIPEIIGPPRYNRPSRIVPNAVEHVEIGPKGIGMEMVRDSTANLKCAYAEIDEWSDSARMCPACAGSVVYVVRRYFANGNDLAFCKAHAEWWNAVHFLQPRAARIRKRRAKP